jgi:L-asparaginase
VLRGSTITICSRLLMASLMKFGSLPPAANPDQPTSEESAAVREKVAEYQAVFKYH